MVSWQSVLIAAVLTLVSMAVCYYSAPDLKQARGMEDMGVKYEPVSMVVEKPAKPGEFLEYSPIITVFICALGFAYMVSEVATKGASVILELNHYVFLFLIVGLLLHWRPRSFGKAIAASVPIGCRSSHPVSAVRRNREDNDGVGSRQQVCALLRRDLQQGHVSRFWLESIRRFWDCSSPLPAGSG